MMKAIVSIAAILLKPLKTAIALGVVCCCIIYFVTHKGPGGYNVQYHLRTIPDHLPVVRDRYNWETYHPGDTLSESSFWGGGRRFFYLEKIDTLYIN